MRLKQSLATLATGTMALLVAGVAQAGVTVIQSDSFDLPTGFALVDNFNSSTPSAVQLTGAVDTSVAAGYFWAGDEWSAGKSGPQVTNGEILNWAAPPVISGSVPDTTNYGYVVGQTREALLMDTPIRAFTIYVGSLNADDTLTFYHDDGSVHTVVGTFGGVNLGSTAPLFGSSRYTFYFTSDVNRVLISATNNSFEFDNIGAAVPELSTWAMFLVGFGALGFMMRGSRRMDAAVTA